MHHILDLGRLRENILTQKIKDMDDIIFEFRKITYYYKFYGVDGVCNTAFNYNKEYGPVCNVWIFAHFGINEIIPNKKYFSHHTLGMFNALLKQCDFYEEEKKRGITQFESRRGDEVKLAGDILTFCYEIAAEDEYILSRETSRDYYSENFISEGESSEGESSEGESSEGESSEGESSEGESSEGESS